MKFVKSIKTVLTMVLGLVLALPAFQVSVVQAKTMTPFEAYGSLKLADLEQQDGTKRRSLVDQKGKPVQLKGMSSFGLQWDDGYWALTDEVFDVLAYDWKCDVIRLAMYITEGGYEEDPALLLERVEEGIRLATERGLYVIVDWHVLSPGNPWDQRHLDAGKDIDAYKEIAAEHPEYNGPQLFFAYLAQKYGRQGNVLYELCNEPNGLGGEDERAEVWSETLKPYYEGLIAVIREHESGEVPSIIICGTDNWSQFADSPADDPIDDECVMYSMHFYAGTHDAGYGEEEAYWLRAMVDTALDEGLAIFCTEWGTSTATGDGGPFIDFAERWLEYLDDNMISWCSWSLARKNEISASCVSTTSDKPVDIDGDGIPEWTYEELSVTGRFIRAKVRGDETPIYEDGLIVQEFEGNLGNLELNVDNPNANLAVSADRIGTGGVARIEGADAGGVWNNRLQLSSQDVTYGIYQSLVMDIYLEADKVDTDSDGAAFSIKPVLQYAVNGDKDNMQWWGDAIPEFTLPMSAFEPVPEDDTKAVAKLTVPLSPLVPAPKDTLEHLVLLISLSKGTEGSALWLDNFGFGTKHNGDIIYLPVIPDEPGTFVKLPFDFESGTREGWAKEGTSAVNPTEITIASAESLAMRFPVAFDTQNNEWEDGARLSSPHMTDDWLSLERCKEIEWIAMDVYLEKDKATTGTLNINVCPIPNGAGYWHQAGVFEIDPLDGEEIIAMDGEALLKYSMALPFSIADYSEEARVRNLVLALASNGSDYTGYVFYDNIRFMSGAEHEDK